MSARRPKAAADLDTEVVPGRRIAASLIVNATSLGQHVLPDANVSVPIDTTALGLGVTVVDLAYRGDGARRRRARSRGSGRARRRRARGADRPGDLRVRAPHRRRAPVEAIAAARAPSDPAETAPGRCTARGPGRARLRGGPIPRR